MLNTTCLHYSLRPVWNQCPILNMDHWLYLCIPSVQNTQKHLQSSIKTLQGFMYDMAENSSKKIIGQKKLHCLSVSGKQFLCVLTALDNNGTNVCLKK